MMQPLVVMTYPGHFLLTALTIQSYFQHHPLVPITVIADDLSKFGWNTYIKDCHQFYNSKIIPVSSILPDFNVTDGWIRQQAVKLHLDQVLPYDTWFFTDGDVEFHFSAPHDTTPYTFTKGGQLQQDQNACVSTLLDTTNPGIWAEHPHMDWDPKTRRHQVCVSNPPFRTMKAETLTKLRQHVQQIHNTSLAQLLIGANHSFSEWELLASFQNTILKENIPTVYYPTTPIGEHNTGSIHHCSTCFTTDSAFSRDWWKEKNILVTDNLWNHIVNIFK